MENIRKVQRVNSVTVFSRENYLKYYVAGYCRPCESKTTNEIAINNGAVTALRTIHVCGPILKLFILILGSFPHSHSLWIAGVSDRNE